MAIGFPAQYTEIVPFAADPQTAIETAKAALEELGLRHTQPQTLPLTHKVKGPGVSTRAGFTV
jgi:hypothetical protein